MSADQAEAEAFPMHPTEALDGTRLKIVIITGLSGAGHSTALKAFEDRGYEAVDNLRLSLLPALIDQSKRSGRPLAVGIDSRTLDFSADAMLAELGSLRTRSDLDVRLLFLDCADDVLQRRFTETRRRHPLAIDRPVSDGIQRERRTLLALRAEADLAIDTSDLSIHDLKRLLTGHFPMESEPGLLILVVSFSFRMGLPREADLVFDVRFLINPHWVPDLRPLTGRDPRIADMVAGDPDYSAFFCGLTDLLHPLLPRYRQEGKSYLTIAVGCSGGRHRSVFVAERLAEWLRARGHKVGLHHRDLERSGTNRGGAPEPLG